ncbi:MAG: Uma2 family endonuclease [Rhodospirillales bacterium]|nr:Uma2 family endonuclease [Rhodospirillales bacterium]
MSVLAEALYRRHRLSVGDFHRMDGAGIFTPEARVELVEGEIIDMNPIGSAHAGKVNFLADRLGRAFRDVVVLSVQNPVIIDDQTELQPDLLLLRQRNDYYELSHPQPRDVFLLVEVADSSVRYDRDVKLPLYARAGIPEVWIVDLAATVLRVCRKPEAGRYTEVRDVTDPGTMSVSALPDIAVDLSHLFGRA